MGLALSRIYGSLSSLAFWSKDKEVRILMVGLDSAGKVRLPPCRRHEGMQRSTELEVPGLPRLGCFTPSS